jgi:hypothetical protein
MPRVELLKDELAAIDRQDRIYWQTEKPSRDEKLEYLVRRRRRRAIIIELTILMGGTENCEQ